MSTIYSFASKHSIIQGIAPVRTERPAPDDAMRFSSREGALDSIFMIMSLLANHFKERSPFHVGHKSAVLPEIPYPNCCISLVFNPNRDPLPDGCLQCSYTNHEGEPVLETFDFRITEIADEKPKEEK